MDHYDAIRFVIFDYLLPCQTKSRCDSLHNVLVANAHLVPRTPEPTLSGLMEHILLISDALLHSRGYPTSFVYTYNRLQHYDCNRQLVNALVIPRIDMHRTFERMADPPAGYKIFGRWRLDQYIMFHWSMRHLSKKQNTMRKLRRKGIRAHFWV